MKTNSFSLPKFLLRFTLGFILVLTLNQIGQAQTTVYTHTFEGNNTGWTLSNFSRTTTWNYDNTSEVISVTNANNDYSASYTATATSNAINLLTQYNLTLEVDIRFLTEGGFDGFNFEYSPNNGTNWYTLGSVGEGTNWYNSTDVDAIADMAQGWTGDNAAWQTARIALPSSLENNANARFRAIFKSDATTTNKGVAFDNFKILSSPNIPTGATYYPYGSSVSWNNIDSWTTDPTSGTKVNSKIPVAGDFVVIKNGYTVTIPAGVNNLTVDKITVEGSGTLDVTTTSGHDFKKITGNGIIKMAGNGGNDNFPAGNCSDFTDVDNGGTLEIYGTGINLNKPRTLRNLKINLTSGSATLLADYALNGNLTVKNGDFKINNTTNTTPLNLSVNSNVLVESAATLTVGTANAVDTKADDAIGNYHKYYHVFTVKGNFTNQGTMRLTNQTAPDFTNQTNNGAVSLVFTGANNNTFNCENTTDLYYLVINKGVDQTNVLTINATAKDHFALFGDNDEAPLDDLATEVNPENRKALWIKTGTLSLEGFVTIPTLTEGFNKRDFIIGENACLELNSPNVFVCATAVSSTQGVHLAIDYTGLSYSTAANIDNNNGEQGFYIFGTLRINEGTLRSGYSYGVTYRGQANANLFEINGGTATISQFLRSSSTPAATATITFKQTGGVLNLVDDARNGSPIFDLSALLGSFIMSGGTINLLDVSNNTTDNAINIACAVGGISVTGGTIILNNTIGNSQIATITSTAPLHNFILRANRGNGVKLISNLDINNDLTIEAENLNSNNLNVNIGSDFFATGGTYTPGTNTTTFDGDKRSTVYLATGAAQTFNNLTISKSVTDKDFYIGSGNATTAIQINGNLRIEQGGVDMGNYNIVLKKDFYLADSLGTKTSGTGKIVLNNNIQQNITSVNGVIKNMEINNTKTGTSQVNLTGNLNIYGTLTLTAGVFDINTYRLTLFGTNSNLTGTFGSTRMIQTNGNASDGGLGLYIKANGTYVFPIGTDDNSTVRYTPLTATYSSYSDDGYVFLSVADNDLPTTDGTGGTMLSYYWHIEHSGFSSLPKVTRYIFSGSESDESSGSAATYSSSWRGGKVLGISPFTRSYEDNTSINNPTGHDINFDGNSVPFDLEIADYSAGPPNRFNGQPEIYFTTYTSGTYAWNTAANWDKTTIGSGNHEVPVSGSIVVIRDGVRMQVGATFTCGAVNFTNTTSAPDVEQIGRIQLETGGTFTFGVVSGPGLISFDTDDAITIAATDDFGDMGTNQYSYYKYHSGSASGADYTLTSIPTPIPNLLLERRNFFINQAINVNYDLIVQGNSGANPMQNITVNRNLIIGNWLGGKFQFPNQATPVTVTIGGNIDMSQNSFGDIASYDRDLLVQNPGATNVEHRLIVKGNILQSNQNAHSIDLWNSNTTARVILELQGVGNHTYSRSSTSVPELYRIVMNKGEDQTNSFSFNNSFTLNGVTTGVGATNKAIELQNGILILNGSGLDINLTTGDPFTIPAEAGLTVTQGTVRANGADGGIALNGLLRINGGTVNMTGLASTTKNYIEYGASSTAAIEISSGSLTVGTQIRRLTTSTTGVLKYTQSGGDVLIGVNSDNAAYDSNRGILEVANGGSQFIFTGGTLTLQRQNGATPSDPTLYLSPEIYQIDESTTIALGNANTPTAQNNFGIYSTIPLNNLTLNAGVGADYPNYLLYQPLTLNGDLTVQTGATLNANTKDLTLQGSFTNNGIFSDNSATLTFNSSDAQTLSGTGIESIYNLIKTGSGNLTLSKSITIDNNFTLSQGNINTDTYSLNTKGNVLLNTTINSTSGNGLVFAGNSQQLFERSNVGTSYIDILTINNPYGAKVTSNGYGYYINKDLRFANGVFDIGGSLLEIGANASLTDVNAFSLTNMIQTNSSFQDKGVRKYFNAGVTNDFFFPVGQLKYTPLTIDLTGVDYTSGTTGGYLSVKPSNEFHPTANDGSNYYSTGDKNNVLQCYWTIGAGTLTGFHGDIIFGYSDADVKIAESTIDPLLGEDDYISARILLNNNPTAQINKFTIDEVNEIINTISFHINGENENGIAGDYFAGLDLAIPNNVATYSTTASGGNVTSSSTFTTALPTEGVAPSGAVINVTDGSNLTFNVDDVQLYRTHIGANATLTINETDGHRLGIVTGAGTLKIVSNVNSVAFPAGDYDTFFDCAGGGVEFAGTGSYTIMAGKPQIRNLTISDGGTKTLANDLEICNNLIMNTGSTTFTIPDNVDLTVNNDFTLATGIFNSGTNNYVTVLGSTNISGGTYNGETSGADILGNVTISSGVFNVGSGGSITIKGNLSYSGGAFTGGSGSSYIALNGTSAQTLNGDFIGTSQFHNLLINNSSGINLTAATTDITIDNQLVLSAGRINTNGNTVLLNANATVSPSAGTATSFINGKVSKTINSGGSFIFPIGAGTRWGYASVNTTSAGPYTWDVEYFNANPTTGGPTNLTPSSATIKSISEKEYWKISDGLAPGGTTAIIGISWDGLSRVSSNSAERQKLEVMSWNSTTSKWDNFGGTNFSSGHTQSNGSFNSSSALTFSEKIITLGSSDPANPLPVELLYFKANPTLTQVDLYWSTASELNNDYFEVQRSTNGRDFTSIGKVDGNGTTHLQNNYAFTDYSPISGTSYYRLKQVDFNNEFEIHPIIAVKWEGMSPESQEINVYPNPYKSGDLILELNNIDPYTSIYLSITDLSGKKIYHANLLVSEDQNVNLVPLAIDHLNQGIYIVSVRTSKKTFNKKVVVQ